MSGDDYGAAGGLITGLASGSRIAGFRLEELIGQGGMAVVYRARDEQLGRLVALKILAPTLARDAEFRRRFSSEWRAAAAIDDPNIVPKMVSIQSGQNSVMTATAPVIEPRTDSSQNRRRRPDGMISPTRQRLVIHRGRPYAGGGFGRTG